MPAQDFETSKEFAEYIHGSEDDLEWVSPLGDPESLQYLAKLPFKYTDNKDERYLDLCCGAGKLSETILKLTKEDEEYSEYDPTVIGVDMAPTQAQIISQDYENMKVFGADANEILEELGTFDFIYGINMLQEFKNQDRIISNIAAAVNEGGHIGFTVTDEIKNVFSDFIVEDSEIGLEYIKMPASVDDGPSATFEQYPESKENIVTKFEDKGFEKKNEEELDAATDPIPEIMDILEKDMSEEQESEGEKPSYPFFLMEKIS